MPTSTQCRRQAFRSTAGTLVALALLLTSLAPVLAASPHRLAGPITDDVSALGGSRSGVQASLDDLQRATDAQLWVLEGRQCQDLQRGARAGSLPGHGAHGGSWAWSCRF